MQSLKTPAYFIINKKRNHSSLSFLQRTKAFITSNHSLLLFFSRIAWGNILKAIEFGTCQLYSSERSKNTSTNRRQRGFPTISNYGHPSTLFYEQLHVSYAISSTSTFVKVYFYEYITFSLFVSISSIFFLIISISASLSGGISIL